MRTLKNFQTSQNALENRIKYHFSDSTILYHALSHSSFANERRLSKDKNNERLEFLGDAVLELVTSEFIYKEYVDLPEGDLTKLRASLVCEPTLSCCARDLQLGEALLLGRGEDITGGRERDSILSDALEAVIGAIYLDGGFTNAKEFIHAFILTDIEHKKLFFDSKTILQEIIQNEYKEKINYSLVSEEGPDHNKTFSIALYIGNEQISCGAGRTKKAAEQEAAYQAILKLQKNKEIKTQS